MQASYENQEDKGGNVRANVLQFLKTHKNGQKEKQKEILLAPKLNKGPNFIL